MNPSWPFASQVSSVLGPRRRGPKSLRSASPGTVTWVPTRRLDGDRPATAPPAAASMARSAAAPAGGGPGRQRLNRPRGGSPRTSSRRRSSRTSRGWHHGCLRRPRSAPERCCPGAARTPRLPRGRAAARRPGAEFLPDLAGFHVGGATGPRRRPACESRTRRRCGQSGRAAARPRRRAPGWRAGNRHTRPPGAGTPSGGGAVVIVIKVAPVSFSRKPCHARPGSRHTWKRAAGGPAREARSRNFRVFPGGKRARWKARRSGSALQRRAITSTDGDQHVVGGGRNAGGT